MKEGKKTFGDVIVELRLIKKISQQKMAEDLELSLERVREIEADKTFPKRETIDLFADYFNVPSITIIFLMLSSENIADQDHKDYLQKPSPFIYSVVYLLMNKEKPAIDIQLEKEKISDN